MRLGALVLPALIVLVAPPQAHAQVPTRTVETFHGVGFAIDVSTSTRPTAQPDDVVARLMSFDLNKDGKIEKAELAERMYTVMDRGDVNRDGCLDRSELQTLANAKPAAAPVVRGFGHGNYVLGPAAEVSSRTHLEGAIDDLRLETGRKASALGIVTTFSQALDANAQTELLDVLKGILSPEQMTTFTRALEQERRMGAQRVEMNVSTKTGQEVRMVRFGSAAISERSVAGFKLAPEANGRAMAALKQYRDRLRPSETDRVELGRQLASVLTEEESGDFLAAIARQPVAEANGFFAMKTMLDSSVDGVVQGIVIKR